MEDKEYYWQVSMQLRYVLAWGVARKLVILVLMGEPNAVVMTEWLLRKR